MNEKTYQNIFDLIQDHLPPMWKKVVLYAGYSTGSFSINFHVMNMDGSYTDCHKLGISTKAQLIKLFMEINNVIKSSRKSVNLEAWTVFTMIVENNGNMITHFDYEDISESPIAHEKKWKEIYLV